MRVNQPGTRVPVYTHEGAPAESVSAFHQLRRSVLSCLLWEREFYENGVQIADRIHDSAIHVQPAVIAALAIEARQQYHLRHVPLLLLCELIRHPDQAVIRVDQLVKRTLPKVIQRADELTEFMALYWATNNGKRTLSAQMKRGLSRAFFAFDGYQLAKYDRGNKVRLRDVMRMAHPKPNTEARQTLWHGLIKQTLPAPDTWEVALTAGADKKATFERLINERKLGYLALLRNLRTMVDAGVDYEMIKQAILARRGAERVLPFRFMSAARAAPRLEPELDIAMQAVMESFEQLAGTTLVLVDISPSMDAQLSAKSDLKRIDAATGLAILAAASCQHVRVFAFSTICAEVPPRKGMALSDAIVQAVPSNSTHLGAAVRVLNGVDHDRLIVITDEQSHDIVPPPECARGYMINVASAKNGVGYGKWTHLDGFSESIMRWIIEHERSEHEIEHA